MPVVKNPLNLQRSLLSITIALSLYSFATSLVGVFIPLIILKNGAPLWVVPGFFVVYAVVKLLLNYPVVLTIQRFGAHFGLGAGFIAGALELVFILLYAHTHSPSLLTAAAAAMAAANAYLWNSQHIHISRVMHTTTKSSSIATIAIIDQVSGVVAPLVGGFIGVVFGPVWLLATALVFALAALLPLARMGELDRAHSAPGPRIGYNLRGAPARDLFANFCFNVDASIGNAVWPIYLAIVIGTYKGIGLIAGVAAAATIIVVWLAGRRGDRGQDRQVLRQGATVSSLVHLLRLVAQTPLTITLVSATYKSSLAYLQNAWVSTYYSHAKDKGIPYVMSMEIVCDLAYVALWSLLLALALTVTSRTMFMVAFTVAAAAAWGCLLISRQGQLTRLADSNGA